MATRGVACLAMCVASVSDEFRCHNGGRLLATSRSYGVVQSKSDWPGVRRLGERWGFADGGGYRPPISTFWRGVYSAEWQAAMHCVLVSGIADSLRKVAESTSSPDSVGLEWVP